MATNEISNKEELSKITERQVLSAYTEGLPHDTKILVKASRPNKLSECVQIASEEETSRINQKEIRKNINDYRNNRSDFNRFSFRCGRTSHQAKQCCAS